MPEGDFSQEWFRQFRGYHRRTMGTIESIRDRLRDNDRRIRQMEAGTAAKDRSWESTVEDADLLIAAVAAAELMHMDNLDMDDAPAGMKQVMDRFPGMDHDSIVKMSDGSSAQLRNGINRLQGYLGEQVAVDLINHGSIPVPDGYHAVLADTTNQPGYDILFENDHGQRMLAQVKTLDSASGIRDHFVRYPDVHIVYANTEAARQMAHDSAVTVVHPGDDFPEHARAVVVDMGVSHDSLRDDVSRFVHHADHDGHFDEIWKKVPVISLMLIAGSTVRAYATTDEPQREILRRAKRRLVDVFTAQSLGHGLDFFVPGDASGMLSTGYLVMINGFRMARTNFVRSADLARSTGTYLSTLAVG